jgi:hypothetical protein
MWHGMKFGSPSWHWFREWRIAEIIGLVVAIVALVVGIYHLKEINKTVDKVDKMHGELSTQLKKTDATLTQVRETLSTRYLSTFPDFVPDIVRLVSDAKQSVVIFCDIPGYAVFSDSVDAGKYCHILEEKRLNPKFRIELTCMDVTSRRNYIAEQYIKFNFADVTLRHRLDAFAASQRIDVRNLQTHPQLIAAIQAADNETLRRTFLNRAVQTPAQMPIYFWIADNKTAIFSIPALSANAIEYGFATSDRDLILAFQNMKRRYDEAVPKTASVVTTQQFQGAPEVSARP